MTHKCDKCNNTTELLIKMGGLICADCRVILFFPNAADGVWAKEFKKIREEYDKKVRNE